MVNPCVYWIHLKEQKDFTTQGYIGVTKRGATSRYQQHRNQALRGKRGILHSNIRKYDELLILDILIEGSESYCYEVEEKLRPKTRIGWNNQRGGMTADRQFMTDVERRSDWINKIRIYNLGKKHSDETKSKISEISKSKHADPVCRKRLLEASSLRKTSQIPKPEFWKRSLGKQNYSDIANSKADLIYDLYMKTNNVTVLEIISSLDLKDIGFKTQVTKLTTYFRSGWNPEMDKCWLHDYKGVS